MDSHLHENEKKITLHVMIEGGRIFTSEYVIKQKIQVLVNKTIEHFGLIDADKRKLRRGDGTVITDYSVTIEDLGLRDGETLKYLLDAPKPDGPKRFA